jgi:hypothetical protein
MGFIDMASKSAWKRMTSALAGTVIAAVLVSPMAAWPQYPGQVSKKSKDAAPELRAVAVLEWTGDLGKPKAARIIPVTIFDGEKLQDAGIYLARPQPLALTSEVEYELKQNGKTLGFFDIQNAGQEQGTWVGYGKWKPLPKPKPAPAAPAKVDEDAVNDEKPVLHRKNSSGTSSGSAPSGPVDPDRPTLHKTTSDDSGTSDSSGSTDSGSGPAPDPDRPKLEKKSPDNSSSTGSSGSNPTPDPNRPTLSKGNQPVQPDYLGNVSAVRGTDDSDRPTLKHGKSAGVAADVTPTLMGVPAEMQQAVAVSDAKNRPDHPWTFAWANPDDENKMKAALEDIAREALRLTPAPAAPAATAQRTTTTPARKTTKPAPSRPASEPLEDEQFRVFELAYGAGATLVLTAHTASPPTSQKFVTIVAQPDLYGNVRVLLKSVTDIAHLDETPRMRLVDAVDALADNRGELLFELRGDGSRQFALYRIYRGTAEKLFVSAGGVYGNMSSE